MRVFIVAGEPSGDQLGAALMAGLTQLAPGTRFNGVGGPGMQIQGLDTLFPMEELSVMGLVEILPRYPRLRRRLSQTVKAVLTARPDVLITVDSPEFTLRLARTVRRAAPRIRIVHYVAPSVWAWRPGRAGRLRGVVDQVLALLPFEPPLLQAAGVACDFVGHPIAAQPRAGEGDALAFRIAHGLGDAETALILPGSRRAEVRRMGPILRDALTALTAQRPGLRAVLPVAEGVAGEVVAQVAGWPHRPVLLDPRGALPAVYASEKRAAFKAADVAIAASGSVSLELAAARTPMVIGYDMHPLSRMILRRMLRTDTVTLVNLVTGQRNVPEFLGAACRPEALAHAAGAVLRDPSAQLADMDRCMELLGQRGEDPGLRAARAVLRGLGRR